MFFKNLKIFEIFFYTLLLIFFMKIDINFNDINENAVNINNIIWKLVFFLNNSYLNVLFIFVIYLYNLFNENKNNKIWFFLCFFTTIHNLNSPGIKIFLNNTVLNVDLYNGMLIIHPILTYITIVFYTNLFFKKKNPFLEKNSILKINNIKFKLKNIFLISALALILGSYWAQQELNWGGWWNWDSVEIILLSFNLLILFLIHTAGKAQLNKYLSNVFIERYFFFIVFFIVVRTNIITSVHAFSISPDLQKYLSSSVLFCFFLFFFVCRKLFYFSKIIFLFKQNYFFRKIFKNKENKKINPSIVFYIINLVIILITLINIVAFIKKFNININLYEYIGVFLKVFILNFFLIFFKNNKINIFIYFIAYNFNNILLMITVLVIFLFFEKNLFFLRKIHMMLVLLVFFLSGDCCYDLEIFCKNPNISVFSNILTNQNEFIFIFEELVNSLNLFLNLNCFFLKSNLDYFLDSESLFNFIFENGLNLNFFNSNLFNLQNKFFLNYILEDKIVFKIDFFLVTSALLVILTLLFYFYIIIIKSNLIFKNNII